MKHLLNVMRREAQQAAQGVATVRLGLVASYDPANYSVKVALQPDGVLTNWMPLTSPWVGNGWGLFCPPTVGDMVEVQFQEGDMGSGFACLRFYNDADRPLSCPPGEFWVVHASGSFVKFHNDGSVEINSAANLVATVGGDANITVAGNITSSAAQWNHTGPAKITGQLVVTQSITGQGGMVISGGSGASITGNISQTSGGITSTGDIKAGAISLKAHTHADPQGGTVGAPQ